MSEMREAVSVQLNICARRFHQLRQDEGSSEHKYWRFENCPADSCLEAKKALGLPVNHPAQGLVEPLTKSREPGAEG